MAEFHFSHKVCTCKGVTLGEIIHAIKEKGAKTIEDLGDITDAGTACGCCRSAQDDFGDPKMELYLEQILNKFAK
ncbi:MAG: (2Fe-2S)-binding protein [Campylobacterales bacterium]|nr:(2Fe-2S)-binding protein [Campylobacterales bacterium]